MEPDLPEEGLAGSPACPLMLQPGESPRWFELQGGRRGRSRGIDWIAVFGQAGVPRRDSSMEPEKSTGRTSGSDGAPSLITPSTALLNRRLGISPAPRMLTRSEIDLLRQSAREIAQATREALGSRGSKSSS